MLRLKSFKQNKSVNAAFCVLLTILLSGIWIILSISSNAESETEALLREYGNAYKIQENSGFIPPEEVFSRLSVSSQ